MSESSFFQVRDRRWVFDFFLCVVVAVPTLLGTAMVAGNTYPTGLALLMVLPLLIRRALPVPAFVVMLVAALATVALVEVPTFSVVAVPILIYTLARYDSPRLARFGLIAGLTGSLLGPARWSLSFGVSQSSVVFFLVTAAACAGTVSAAYLIARRRREGIENSAARARSDEERQRLLLVEQEQRERMATVAERNRIARELHDIVAHSLSVIVVQAEGGKALAAKRPEKGPEVLGTIAETSREALEEMRRMVGLLRSGVADDEQAAYRPQPGLADIADLVRKTSDTAELSHLRHPAARSAGPWR